MKASILKRLEALEEVVSRHATPPLRFVDVTKLPDDDRDAYWDGDESVLSRYVSDTPDQPPDVIHTVVVTLNPESRSVWEATRHMTGDEQEAWEERQIRASDREELEPTVVAQREIRYDAYGYPINES